MGKIWQANQNKTKTTIKSNGYIGPVLGHVQKCGNDKLVNRILTLSSWWVDRRHLPPLITALFTSNYQYNEWVSDCYLTWSE
jgi:hypothetical protein